MITLSPINQNIQTTLNEKISMLQKRSGKMEENTAGESVFVPSNEIGAPISDGNGVNENYMFSRTPFFRMTSFQDSETGPIVLMGGELDFRHRLKSGFMNREAIVNEEVSKDGLLHYHGMYDPNSEMPFRPIAGVESIDIAYKGGGMKLGATRTADISWMCFNWEDLSKYTPHFLAHSKVILIEWGWSGVGKLSDVQLYPLFTDTLTKQFSEMGERLVTHIERQNGHYDAMLGKITNFDWSAKEDGGFQCTTTIVSPGITLMEKKFENIPSEKLKMLPSLSKRVTDAKIGTFFDTEAKYESNLTSFNMAYLAPYITFKEYMKDFPNQVQRYIELTVPGLVTFSEDGSIRDLGWGKHPKHKGYYKQPKNWNPNFNDTDEGNAFYDTYWSTTRGHMKTGIGEKVICASHIEGWKSYTIQERTVEEARPKNKKIANAEVSRGGTKDVIRKKINKYVADTNSLIQMKAEASRCTYVTWGWFEDNVLSRFFGHIVNNQQNVLGEFRSIEMYYTAEGKSIMGKKKSGGEKDYSQIIKQSTRMYNSKFLMSIDAAKWLIPNKNDPLLLNMVHWFGNGKSIINSLFETDEDIGLKAKAGNGETLEGKELDKFAVAINKATPEYMPMRNILFNTEYLANKLSEVDDLASGVQDVWDEFSSVYGGVYKFTMIMSDTGESMMLKEEGYTQYSVRELLGNARAKQMGENPAGPNLFVFPTWEAGSIVKSQNINAKVPDRMKLTVMYGASTARSIDDDAGQNTYDAMAALAWGRLNSGNPRTRISDAHTLAYMDYYSGDIDLPNRGNRKFGRTSAFESHNLYIQNYTPGVMLQMEAPSDSGPGIQIYPTILDEIKESQIELAKTREAEYKKKNPKSAHIDDDGNVNMVDAKVESDIIKELFAGIDSIRGSFWNKNTESKSEWQKLYSMTISDAPSYFDTIFGSTDKDGKGLPQMKMEALHEIQGFFRGDNGVTANVDPLIPIDFDIEIDGTGGMYPGNSFHSSYLPDRYRKEAVFQMKGVAHKIDSSGWFTTITGQIRAKRKTPSWERISSGGKGKDPKHNSGKNKGREIGPNGEEVFTNSKGFKYYFDSKQVDPKTGKGVIKQWKGNPDIEVKSIYPTEQDYKSPESGEESKGPKPIMRKVSRTLNQTHNFLEPWAPQNVKIFGAEEQDKLPGYSFGESFYTAATRVKADYPDLLISKSPVSEIKKVLKVINPDKWVEWVTGLQGFPKGAEILIGFEEEGDSWSDPGDGWTNLPQFRG